MTDLRELLEGVASGALSIDDAITRIGPRRDADLGFATVDHDRAARCGFPEVVYCAGKTPAQAAAIAEEILKHTPRVLLTRAHRGHADAVATRVEDATYHETARCITVDRDPLPRIGAVGIVAAGTADLPVAEEAALTASILGARVEAHHDVGVAGLHRLLERIPSLRQTRALVVVAGMEGALASVVGGLVDRPVIAVPTSIGEGLHLDGIVPLLAMLNSCASGVAVVNVDNGFGAGYLAALINRTNDPSAPPRAP